MTERSPIPACLSHLTQRDAAVRARALEEAAKVVSHQSTAASECWLGMSGQFKLGHITARDEVMAAIRALLPIPAYAPAPDEAAIRAELVAVLRWCVENDEETLFDNPRVLAKARAALAKAAP